MSITTGNGQNTERLVHPFSRQKTLHKTAVTPAEA